MRGYQTPLSFSRAYLDLHIDLAICKALDLDVAQIKPQIAGDLIGQGLHRHVAKIEIWP